MYALVALAIVATVHVLIHTLRLRSAGEELLRAAFMNDIEGVDRALSRGAPCDYRDEQGMTALMWAAFSGAETAVRRLLAEAQCDAQDYHGRTALLWATRYGHAGVARILMHADDDANCHLPGPSVIISHEDHYASSRDRG
jgi:ankyrin repeat protein